MPVGSVSSIALRPLGTLSLFRAQDLAARLSVRVGVPCAVEASADDGFAAFVAGRDQLDADLLLARLEAPPAPKGGVLIGVTPADLAIPIFTFVFGRARAGGHAALVSLARLDPGFYGLRADPELAARRAVQEMLHELGHLASLGHCPDAGCVMSFAGSVEKIDVRGPGFCAGCATRLPAWLHEGRRADREAHVGHMVCSS